MAVLYGYSLTLIHGTQKHTRGFFISTCTYADSTLRISIRYTEFLLIIHRKTMLL